MDQFVEATPPVRLSTPPIGAVVASCTLTGSVSVPAPLAVNCRSPGRVEARAGRQAGDVPDELQQACELGGVQARAGAVAQCCGLGEHRRH